MSRKKTVSRRRFLGGVLVAGVASASAGAGTYAWISDTHDVEFSFQAGSVALTASPDTIQFTSANDAQDDGSVMGEQIELTNVGTLDANAISITSLELTGPSDLQNAARVRTFGVLQDDGSTTPVLTNPSGVVDYNSTNSNGWLDLADLSAYLADGNQVGLGEALTADAGNTVTLVLEVEYEYAAVTTNGGVLEADFEFEASQQ